MSPMKRTITALGLIAASVVVRCGDTDDDDEEKRKSASTASAYAQAVERRSDMRLGKVEVRPFRTEVPGLSPMLVRSLLSIGRATR